VIETLSIEITEREMRKIEIAHVPSGGLSRITIHRLAEKRKFESEAMAAGRFEIAGVIPPLGLKIRVTEMIAGKCKVIAGQGGAILRCERRQSQ
jgi:hypothetical protein